MFGSHHKSPHHTTPHHRTYGCDFALLKLWCANFRLYGPPDCINLAPASSSMRGYGKTTFDLN
jgi:hypothetical protein